MINFYQLIYNWIFIMSGVFWFLYWDNRFFFGVEIQYVERCVQSVVLIILRIYFIVLENEIKEYEE